MYQIDAEHRTFIMPQQPTIAITDGFTVSMFTDTYSASEGTVYRPIERAAAVTRLRALADEIERAATT